MADAKISALTAWTTPIGADYVPIVDSAAVTTKKITLTNLGLIDGWTPASETWTYASASTITVPSGAASKYQKGDRIKWTQTTVKYGVIVTVADTLLTIAVNTDYTVANAAISANYYSHQDNPIGYPTWFNYSPSQAGTNMPTSSTLSALFAVSGCEVTVLIRLSGTANASTTTFAGWSLPIATSLYSGGDRYGSGGGMVTDMSTFTNVVQGWIETTQGICIGFASCKPTVLATEGIYRF